MTIVDTLAGRMIDTETDESMGWWAYVVRVDGDQKGMVFGDAASYNRLREWADDEFGSYEIITVGTSDPSTKCFEMTLKRGTTDE